MTGPCFQARLVVGFAAAVSWGIGAPSVAYADYAQAWGISTRCLAKAGACVADQGDVGSFYHNPAAASDFTSTTIGGNIFFLDTRPLEITDSLGTHNPTRTSIDGTIAALPSLAVYTPIGNTAVIGLGLGAPNGVVAEWANKGVSRYDSLNQSLAVFDASPNLAWKPYSWLSLGAAVNVQVGRQLGLNIGIPNSPAFGGAPVTASTPLIGQIGLESNKDLKFGGVPPGSLELGFHAVSLTLGARAEVNDRMTVGASLRTKTSETWGGNAILDLTPIGAGTQKVKFTSQIDLPAHLQAGFTYKLIPSLLDVSLDIQRTFWSETNGFGKPFVVNLASPLVFGPATITQISASYHARDANTYRLGAVVHATKQLDLMAGYAFDEKVFPDKYGDIITFDSNRHIFSVGGAYDTRASLNGTGWEFATALQLTHYETKTIAAGAGANLGGLSAPSLVPNSTGLTLGLGANGEKTSLGGDIYSLTAGATYHF